ncbi:hypothetical protein KUV85_00005 [Nocardioides panacisoli]|uniref:hypothetical protein n=1 Tax=Nocardioides panacisoli TaxID=627624 RepID=UPI001C626B01|nr:hypothetical protein [Nocardioides panacisoli]QYJ04096.1 hypothetical protein KUV85_00005 [Nocardioides panacisoli]
MTTSTHCTIWDYYRQRFERNRGLRIDFVLGSPTFADRVTGAFIDTDERNPAQGTTSRRTTRRSSWIWLSDVRLRVVGHVPTYPLLRFLPAVTGRRVQETDGTTSKVAIALRP